MTDWRARPLAEGRVMLEYRPPGEVWLPARVLTAEEADGIGRELQRAAQESRRRALVFRSDCHGGDCDDFPDCPCGGWRPRRGTRLTRTSPLG